MPSYKNDKRYGGLIVLIPPFNLLAYFLLPVYVMTKDREKLAKINDKVCRIIYSPIAFLMSAFFFTSSVLIAFPAWIKVIVHKLMRGTKLNALGYFVLGIPVLIITAVTDTYWFV